MIIVAVTGSFAAGKSRTAGFFKKLGAGIFDADEVSKKTAQKGRPVYKAIVRLFGKEYLQKNGELDRKRLARRVFAQPKDLRMLNTLIHPAVIMELFRTLKGLRHKKGMLVLDVPLLFESKMEKLVDVIVVVRSSQKNIFKRARLKGVRQDLAEKILSAQWPMKKKTDRADFVLDNNGNLKELEARVRRIYGQILKMENTI